ncbi:hypothetical protein BRD00_04685 [Halobacteriales archaeon QS_8_69_26]|nr:MAG: hypothetical protein BRD00_04685 [Halobacteriales archaeon QS_8_69_26]
MGAVGLSGCLAADGGRTDAEEGTPTPPDPAEAYWYTHPRPTGNRYLGGDGDLRGVDPVTIEGRPKWLVAHPADRGSHWTLVTDEGRATRWRVADGEATRVGEYDPLPGGAAPAVATGEGDPRLVRPPPGAGEMASPVVAPGGGSGVDAGGEGSGSNPKLLCVAGNGDLIVAGEEVTRLEVDAPPDARLSAVGDGRYALFGDATDRYTHGALGDVTEGSSVVLVDPSVPEVDARASVGPPEVFEGIQPLVADLDGDGDPEIVAALADSENGARMAVFDADGDHVATGPIHEPGWRHQLVVAPLGPDGGPELAVVRKPHVDKLLEFYRLDGGSLDVAASHTGFSTHSYGSRIEDGAIAGDLDGDGATEVLLPTSDRDVLAAVSREPGDASVAWTLDPAGTVRTNLTGIALPDGRVAVGVGTEAGVRIWQG